MNVLITGASSGIGLELCKQYSAAGHTVYALCRNSSTELSSLSVNIFEGIDIRDISSIEAIYTKINTIDVLINNAGILSRESLDEMDFDNILLQFQVNALGALQVTHSLLPLLKKGSKIIFISSRMGSIADNLSGSLYGYRISKAAMNMIGKTLAVDLKKQEISVGIFHPGAVNTKMTRHNGDISAASAAEGIIQRAEELSLETSGKFLHIKQGELPW